MNSIYIYIYIYIYRQRERERERDIHMCMPIRTHIFQLFFWSCKDNPRL